MTLIYNGVVLNVTEVVKVADSDDGTTIIEVKAEVI